MDQRQIFQTNSPARWAKVKWSTRLLLLFIPLAVLAFIIAMGMSSATIPRLREVEYKPLKDTESFVYRNSKLVRNYYGFRKFIAQREKNPETGDPRQFASQFQQIRNTTAPCAIRSAFYVDWDPQSLYSLQRNISKLNLVIPEWFFLDEKADTLTTRIDPRALAIMRKAGVNIMPMLSNFIGDRFRGDVVHRILHHPGKRAKLIADLSRLCHTQHFAGINIDLEELEEDSDEAFVDFQRALYNTFSKEGLMVTQDVIPFNGDYDYRTLAQYNDYIFIMAYDEFSEETKAGPVAEQKWIEAAIDDAAKKIPSHKIILGLAAYGYDWPDHHAGTTVTYQQALVNARDYNAPINFDNDTYNVYYRYRDDNAVMHDVYFTDAASAFNSMRFATEGELGGVALWRLGSEDSRIWNFYHLDFSKQAISRFNFNAFTQVQSPDDADYNGSGEVLDVIATPTKGSIRTEQDREDWLISEEHYDSLPSMFVVNAYGWNKMDTARNRKKIVLTFDDGPDPAWTPRILDVLARKHVPASFFVVGRNVEENIPILKRIYREGHEIGNHTFTHPNIAEVSPKRAVMEMEATRLLIECITGHSTVLFRAPYNADFQPEKWEELQPVALARTKNYLDVGESIDPMDWEPGITADTVYQRVMDRKKEMNEAGLGGNIILLHDAGGDSREATLEALPRIIDTLKKQGYIFTTVADYLGKPKNAMMPPVPKGSGYYWIQANIVLVETTYWISHILFSLFIIFILLSVGRMLLMTWLAMKEKRKERMQAIAFPALPQYPLVSIIVPAYNEEVNAVSALHHLLRTQYPNFNIIFVDDGSKDTTYEKVLRAFEGHNRVQVFTKHNGGKASALNFGIHQTDADYVVCIDADTQLHPGAVSALMKHFLLDRKKEIGAVAGNVKVGNEVNWLTRWQAIEYISSQNFDRRAFAYVNGITVVPGAVGAFRKKAIEEAGGFTTDTLAEDCDITVRILKEGYQVKNETEALAFTEAPENLKQFIRQRFRWSFGILQTFWKHKHVLFNRKYGWLGMLSMPNILLFQYIIPFFIPLADLFMVVGLITGNAAQILPWYMLFMLVDAGMAVLAFRMERERMSRLVWLIPQRLVYRWFMWWVLFKSIRRAIKGELQSWGVLKRTGSVKEMELV